MTSVRCSRCAVPRIFIATGSLQLRLPTILRLLQHPFDLPRLHHIALDLQLPGHEQLLSVGLALDQLPEVRVGQDQRHVRLLTIGCGAFADGAAALEVHVPRAGRALRVAHLEVEDGLGAADGGFGGGGG